MEYFSLFVNSTFSRRDRKEQNWLATVAMCDVHCDVALLDDRRAMSGCRCSRFFRRAARHNGSVFAHAMPLPGAVGMHAHMHMSATPCQLQLAMTSCQAAQPLGQLHCHAPCADGWPSAREHAGCLVAFTASI